MDTLARLRLSPQQALNLADTFGTPLYVVDEVSFRARLRQYKAAMADFEGSRVFFASKANPSPALVRIANQEGFFIDVASSGELDAALFAEVSPEQINFHGNFKSLQELELAVDAGIGEITIDNADELEEIKRLTHGKRLPKVNIRICPSVEPDTHEKIRTGQSDSKFGIPIVGGDAEAVLLRARDLGIPIHGLHAHVGSQLMDAKAQSASAFTLAEFAVEVFRKHGVTVEQLNVGGGLGVPYRESGARPQSVESYVEEVNEIVQRVYRLAEIPCPRIVHEPGRALIAESGVTLYTVGAVKELPSDPVSRFVAVDGGLYENPRSALYGAEYDLELVPRSARGGGPFGPCTVAGKHCETDSLFLHISFDAKPEPGDVIQVFSTGAYTFAMASNYNRLARPAMVLIRQNGQIDVISRRESLEDLRRRDHIPNDL